MGTGRAGRGSSCREFKVSKDRPGRYRESSSCAEIDIDDRPEQQLGIDHEYCLPACFRCICDCNCVIILLNPHLPTYKVALLLAGRISWV